MAAKKREKKEVPVARFAPGDLVRVLYRGIEHVGTVQASELRRGAIAYQITWDAESLRSDPALRGMKHVTEGDVTGIVGSAPTRALTEEGFAARMAARRVS